jgi:PAS domain S-box-containing protein
MEWTFDGDAGALGRVLASLPQIVVIVDRDGLIRYVNRVLPGYDRSQVLGMPASALDFGDSREVFETALRAVLDTGEPSEYEVSIIAPDGTRRWFRSQILPHLDGNTVAGALIVALDVTELIMAQKAVSELRQLLPVCAWCGQIQNDDGDWETVAQYLGERMQTSVTHGMCPSCQQEQLLALDRPKGWDTRY